MGSGGGLATRHHSFDRGGETSLQNISHNNWQTP